MEIINKLIEDSYKNYNGPENRRPSKLTMTIWTGPMMDNSNNTIYQSKGYYKDSHMVLCCSKSSFKQLNNNTYNFRPEDIRETQALISKYTIKDFDSLKKNSSPLNENEHEGISIEQSNNSALIELLTFSLNEVYGCYLAPNALYNIAGGVLDPALYEIEINLDSEGSISAKNAMVIHSPYIKRETIHNVPRGGGQKISEYRNNIVSYNYSNEITDKTRGAVSLTNNQFGNPFCFAFEPDLAFDGDVWFEGLKMSITNGIYELWCDDIGGGPLLKASRKSVSQAASRYYMDINPVNLRYNGYRVNPLSTRFSSNAITPVKHYIEDIFGDPTFYAGIIQVLTNVLSGIKGKNSNFIKNLKLNDIDYESFYKDKLGQEI